MGRRDPLRLRQLIRYLVILTLAGCSHAEQPAYLFEVSGRIEDGKIVEASGLARSQKQTRTLWVINDAGNEDVVHALDDSGERLGEFELKSGKNRDWEDLASFYQDSSPYLMIADIGDNEAKYNHGTLYFVKEPEPEEKGEAKTDWKVEFRYPEGPRDAESAAVDVANSRVLVLTKRDRPPRLYSIPFTVGVDDSLPAEFLGTVTSLPTPTQQDIQLAPKNKSWWWQPVGMDISQDGKAAVILTYRAVFYFERDDGQAWHEALNGRPYAVSLGNFMNAEAVAFGNNQRTVIVTGENKHSRILRVNLTGAMQHAE